MSIINWDLPGDRVYQNGLDRGVLYLPDGSAVPWNGLTSIIEKFDRESTEVSFEGVKISHLVTLGDFSATMKALTYPEEFSELETAGENRPGMFLGDRPPQLFGLCYRTHVGDDINGFTDYKIHILYNVTAVPRDKTYETFSDSIDLVEFEWDITAIPEEFPGYRPTAHVVIDSRTFDPWLLEELEAMLYGSSTAVASLLPLSDLVTYLLEWFRFQVTDNGDGTATIVSRRDSSIDFNNVDPTIVTLIGINLVYLDDDSVILSDTYDISQLPAIKIVDNGDGTWIASSENPNVIFVDPSGTFEIRNANAVFLTAEEYQISDAADA